MKHLSKINRLQFLTKIYDYEANPNKFLYTGTAPGILIFGSPQSRFCIELEPALEILAKKHKNNYDVYYINTTEEPELKQFFVSGDVPVFYLCPVSGEPTIVKETINIKEIARLADKIFHH